MSSATATSPARPSPSGQDRPGHAPRPGTGMGTALRPLLIDVGIPLGSYYLLRDAFGLSLWLSLALSSAGPAARSVASLVGERRLNVLAALMLAVNLAGIAVSFLTGDPRAMIAKDSVISSVIAFAILGSVIARRPLMSVGLRPFMTQGTPERGAAWDRLAASSARFRRFELAYSAIWGVALLADCAARLVGAYTLPVTTMVWMSTVLTLSAVGVGVTIGGAVAAMPILRMVETEIRKSLPVRLREASATVQPRAIRSLRDRACLVGRRTWPPSRSARSPRTSSLTFSPWTSTHPIARRCPSVPAPTSWSVWIAAGPWPRSTPTR